MYRELNLVPKVYNQVKETKKRKRSAIVGIVGLLVVILGGIAYTFGYEFYLNVKLGKLNEQVQMNSELIEKEQQLTADINATSAQISKAESLKVLKSQKTDLIFKALQKYFPSNVRVESLSYTKTGINISAKATTKESIEELWANLRETTEFKNCHVSGISGDAGDFGFSLDITLIEVVEGGTK